MSEKEPSWPPGADAAERVRHVVLTQTEPQNAGWIATEADVSRDTAVKYLTRMVDRGELEVTETAEGMCYKPDSVTQLLREVRQLAEEHTLDELTQELNAIGEEIDGWKERFGVDSLAELRKSIGSEDLTGEDRHERLEVIKSGNTTSKYANQFSLQSVSKVRCRHSVLTRCLVVRRQHSRRKGSH